MWAKTEKAHVVHISGSLIWLSGVLEQPNLLSLLLRHMDLSLQTSQREGGWEHHRSLKVFVLPTQGRTAGSVPPFPHAVPSPAQTSREGLLFISKEGWKRCKPRVYYSGNSGASISCLGSQELREVESSCLGLRHAVNLHKNKLSLTFGRICSQLLKSFAQNQTSNGSSTVSLQPSCCGSASVPCTHFPLLSLVLRGCR